MDWEEKYPAMGKGMDVLRLLGDLLVVNLLWLITSLPIVTLGAASSAAYGVLLRYVREGGVPIGKTYFKCFRENFLQATALWFLTIGMALVVYVDWQFAGSVAGVMHTVYLALSLVLCGGILVMLTVAIPIQAYYRNSLGNIIKNAFLMALCAPGWTLLIWAIWGAVVLIVLVVPYETVITLGSLFLMWGFSFPAWLGSRCTLRIFRICDPGQRAGRKPEEREEG